MNILPRKTGNSKGEGGGGLRLWNSEGMGGGGNAFWNFRRQGGVKTWKPSVVRYGYFLELPIHKLYIDSRLSVVIEIGKSQKGYEQRTVTSREGTFHSCYIDTTG